MGCIILCNGSVFLRLKAHVPHTGEADMMPWPSETVKRLKIKNYFPTSTEFNSGGIQPWPQWWEARTLPPLAVLSCASGSCLVGFRPAAFRSHRAEYFSFELSVESALWLFHICEQRTGFSGVAYAVQPWGAERKKDPLKLFVEGSHNFEKKIAPCGQVARSRDSSCPPLDAGKEFLLDTLGDQTIVMLVHCFCKQQLGMKRILHRNVSPMFSWRMATLTQFHQASVMAGYSQHEKVWTCQSLFLRSCWKSYINLEGSDLLDSPYGVNMAMLTRPRLRFRVRKLFIKLRSIVHCLWVMVVHHLQTPMLQATETLSISLEQTMGSNSRKEWGMQGQKHVR